MTVPALAVNVAVLDGTRVLLTLREDFEVWCLPGGQLDEGEAPVDAAVREVREETGLEIRVDRLVGLYSRPALAPRLVVVVAARTVGGTLRPDPAEVLDARFFEPADLPDALLWGQRERIEDAVAGLTGVLRTTTVVPPTGWPVGREAQYAARDASGLGRAAFYARLVEPLGPERGRRDA